ncbi:hypothetical protein V1J52_19650 [Streptomyces sp. TRM 70351]|uniref:hypothetical protein n=1 Tax=Streptomyces sp. TRM 70351 TaxID=3116552 RepID=UPI002E7C311C|nr:hypothetical protein [Streptomyces sp. TRM 70351]MEE1930369.1 hypothetical protein [Streptomyces sp. TRM 70351]
MHQCTATALLSPPEGVTRLATPDQPVRPAYVLCELGEGHDHDHAQMLWEDDVDDGAVWVRWKEDRATFAELRWCPELTPAGDGCGLFTDHPSAHGWDVVDPTREALVAELAKNYPDLLPDHGPEAA